MYFFYNLLVHTWTFLNFLTTCFLLYQLCISLAGLNKAKQFPESVKYHRFAAIIAARNEEAVLPLLIESIKMQNYPKDLLDIIVIADNCSDNTAAVAEKAGAIVFKRFNKAEVGKSYALKFAFSKIFEERDIYDAFCILDADNILDRNFIYNMNKALCAGYSIAQGYRDMKNPSDTWVSGGHSIFYWMQNRFYNTARSFLGLSANINGTGYYMSVEMIKKMGWNITTITEDIEITMQSALAGRKIGWVPDAVVYDEQPLSLQQSMRQRIRWIAGFYQVFDKYIASFFSKLTSKPDWITFDAFMFLSYFPVLIVSILSYLLYFVLAVFRLVDTASFIMNTGVIVIGAVLSFWGIAFLSMLMEKKSFKNLMKAVWNYPLFNLTWVAIYLICFFKRDIEWKPITHLRNISLKEIEASKPKNFNM